MKHKLLRLALVSFGLLGMGVFSKPTNVKASSYNKAYTTKNSIVFKNSKGIMRIYQVKAANLRNGSDKDFEHVIYLYGSFTNKSSRSIRPTDFFNSHFKAFQIFRSKVHELDINNVAGSPTEYTNTLGNNGDDYTRPNRSVRFAVSDEFAPHFYLNQKISIHAYKDVGYSKTLKKKTFKLSGIYDAQVVGDNDTQQIYSYTSEVTIRRAKKRAAKKAKKIKQAKNASNAFMKNANKYDVFWGNNKAEMTLTGVGHEGNEAFIRNVGVINPLVMISRNSLQICFYFDNSSNSTVNIMDMVNKYFDIMDTDGQKIHFKIDDVKRYNIAKPKKSSAVTLTNTNNINVGNGAIFKVKNSFSTNQRTQYILAAN